MELEKLKWWHWLILSVPLGWLLAYVNSAPVEPTATRTDEQAYFERAILHGPASAGSTQIPWIRNLIIYPPINAAGPQGEAGDAPLVTPVTYEELTPIAGGQPGSYQYEKCWFGARTPYTPTQQSVAARGSTDLPPGIEKTILPTVDSTLESITQEAYGKTTIAGMHAISGANLVFATHSHSVRELISEGRWRLGRPVLIPWNPDQNKTVRDWLDAAKSQYSFVDYKFAWWKVPKNCQMMWMGISVGAVGIVWPATIAILTGAGLSVGRKEAQAQYDLSRFSGKSAPAKVVAKPELDEAGREKLAAMNAALTADLAAAATDGSGKAAAVAAPAAAPGAARKLATEEVKPGVVEQPQDQKDYSGEFYPVAHPAVKPTEDQSSDKPKNG